MIKYLPYIICFFYCSHLLAQPEFVWAKDLSGTGTSDNSGSSIAVDKNGNVYTTGKFWGTVDFDPGAGSYPISSGGNHDAFVSKLDASGNFVWAFRIGGTSAEYGYGICTDTAGNVYVTGVFSNTVDFDPSASSYTLTSAGGWDAYVAKYNPAGTLLWAKRLGGTASDIGYAIAVDTIGNVYTAGWYGGTADFDPGAGTASLVSTGGDNAFISKLDASGNYKWAKQMGGTDSDRAYCIVVDGQGNVYTGGWFSLTADFDPSAGAFNMTSSGMTDIYVSKLDSLGTFKWASSFHGLETDWCFGIAIDSIGNVYTTGSFTDSADFDPGVGVHKLISNGSMDAFVSKLDSLGQFVWAAKLGGADGEVGRAIKVDQQGNVHSTGYYSSIADFDPGSSVFNIHTVSGFDVYASSLDTAGAFLCAGSMGGTGSTDYGMAMDIDPNGFAYYTGEFSGTADFNPETPIHNLIASGTTDTYVVKLIACAPCVPTASELTLAVCSNYVSPSGNYIWSTSGTYRDTIPNVEQCDSVITFHLSINSNSYSNISPSACENYTVPSGDEIYTQSGDYTDTIPNVNGCDSIISIHLTMLVVNTGVSVAGNTLTANANGVLYQWVDCNNAFMTISGATNQSFTPTVSGSYAVVIYQYGCFEMSNCFQVTITETEEIETNTPSIFPNPTSDFLIIDSEIRYDEIQLLTMTGKCVYRHELNENKTEINMHQLPAGIYIVRLIGSDFSYQQTFIKE